MNTNELSALTTRENANETGSHLNETAVRRFNADDLTMDAYRKAKVLEDLASVCHERSNMLVGGGQHEWADIYSDIGTRLDVEARQTFPLYAHPDHKSEAVQNWLSENTLEV